MPTVRVYCDERYPEYDIVGNKTGGKALEITEAELAFILKARDDYEKAQAILKRAY